MFDRFTDRSRKVMGLARQAAQEWCHDYIGTEHILLGILAEGSGVASLALKNLKVDVEQIRIELRKLISVGVSLVTMGQLPFTPRCKKVLEFSLEEAANLGHTYIGTEHLLLGLIREGSGSAFVALTACGVSAESVRKEVLNVLGADAPTGKPESVDFAQSVHVMPVVTVPMGPPGFRWSDVRPTTEGWFWVRGGPKCWMTGPVIVEVYESVGGLRIKGECCGCVWRGDLVSDLVTNPNNPPGHFYQWAGPVPSPSE